MKYLIGILIGWSLAYGMFGDSARYGREVWSDVQECEYRYKASCTSVPVVIRVDKANEDRQS